MNLLTKNDKISNKIKSLLNHVQKQAFYFIAWFLKIINQTNI